MKHRAINITREVDKTLRFEFMEDGATVETYTCPVVDYAANLTVIAQLQVLWFLGCAHAEVVAWISVKCQPVS